MRSRASKTAMQGRLFSNLCSDEIPGRDRLTFKAPPARHQLFSHLGVGQLRELAGAKLEGYANAELAERFGCSERTIERRLHLIREKCQQELFEYNEHPPKEITDRGSGADR